MWAVMASPLLISGNIRNMSTFLLDTYKNKEVRRERARGEKGGEGEGGR
jgi:hypothetical protein